MRTEILNKNHDVGNFDCGIQSLNNYLQISASQHTKRGQGVTQVLIDDDELIAGYYTLAANSVQPGIIPSFKGKGAFPVPTTLLACFAVILKYQGTPVSGYLLREALARAYEGSKIVGSHAVVLDALNDRAKRFTRNMILKN